MYRSFFSDNTAFLITLTWSGMAAYHIDALNNYTIAARENMQNLAGFQLVGTSPILPPPDNDYIILFYPHADLPLI